MIATEKADNLLETIDPPADASLSGSTSPYMLINDANENCNRSGSVISTTDRH